MHFKIILIAIGVCVSATACSVLSPQPDHAKFYILTPIADRTGIPASTSSMSPDAQLTIGVGPVDLPDYLRRFSVVTRVAPNRIDLSDEKLWAEPLDKNFTRVLSENLATLLETQRIERYPWSLQTKVNYQIEIDVQQFETTSDGQARLVAGWIIRDSHSKILCASITVTGAASGPDATSASAALSSDLAILSRDIASRVSKLNQHHGTTDVGSNTASTS
jgi:uncharacterized lipoprotein YmbA